MAVTFEAEVTQVVLETMDVLTIRFAIPPNVDFSYRPGQFVNLTVDTPEYGPDQARLTRPYSISSSPTDPGFIDLTVKYYEDGHVSKHLREVTYIGEVVTLNGPHGRFGFQDGEATRIALIGGGAGVAPMRGIVQYVVDRDLDVDIRYIASCRTPSDTIFLVTLMAWGVDHPHLHVIHTITRPDGTDWNGPVGRIDRELLAAQCPPETTDLYFVAGPTGMVKHVRQLLKEELGVPKERVRWEPWG